MPSSSGTQLSERAEWRYTKLTLRTITTLLALAGCIFFSVRAAEYIHLVRWNEKSFPALITAFLFSTLDLLTFAVRRPHRSLPPTIQGLADFALSVALLTTGIWQSTSWPGIYSYEYPGFVITAVVGILHLLLVAFALFEITHARRQRPTSYLRAFAAESSSSSSNTVNVTHTHTAKGFASTCECGRRVQGHLSSYNETVSPAHGLHTVDEKGEV